MTVKSFAAIMLIGLACIAVGCVSTAPEKQPVDSSPPFDRAVFIRSRVEASGDSLSVEAKDGENPDSEEEKRRFRMVTGTGFFLRVGDSLYFVTAKHVAKEIAPHSQLAFLNERGESRMFRLGQLLRGLDDFKCRHHSDADVSVIKLFPKPGIIQEVRDLSISSESLSSITPPRATKAVICGFPMGQGTHGKISPITSVVHVASKRIPVAFARKLMDSFLVSPPAGSGFSGGPVFYEDPETHEYLCIGLLSGSIADVSGGKLSTVAPAVFISELLETESSVDGSQHVSEHYK